MKPAIIILTILVCTACEPRGLYYPQDGEALLDEIVSIGSTIESTCIALAEHDIQFQEIQPNECGEAGDMYIYPGYLCAGGTALRLFLSDDARPYNPFYSPTMTAFLAFDESDRLVSVTIMLEGGD